MPQTTPATIAELDDLLAYYQLTDDRDTERYQTKARQAQRDDSEQQNQNTTI